MADVTGDGNLDMVSSYAETGISSGNGDGTFSEWHSIPGPVGSHVAVDDFNADGEADVAVATGYDGRDGHVLLGNGNWTFQPPLGYGNWSFQSPLGYGSGANAGSLTTADFDGDGKWDLLTAHSVSLGNGNGTFRQPISFPASPFGMGPTAVADLNGDDRPDVVVTTADGTVRVLINDGHWTPAPPAATVSDAMAVEGNTGTRAATFTVTLSSVSGETVTISYATADGTAASGSDYQTASGTVTFAPGETTKSITVPVTGDRHAEPNETFVVNLSSPTNATVADGQGVGTIVDDEPRISIGDVSRVEGRKGQTTLFTFTVTLSTAYDQPVTMSFRTVNGTATTGDGDYVAKTGALTIGPGLTTKTITIKVKGDSRREADEYFSLDLFGNSGNSLFTKKRGTGTIVNDD